MTALGALRPRVCMRGDRLAADLSSALSDALVLLAEAKRIELIDSDQPGDIVHTVGSVEAARTPGRRRVHTVDTVPLRVPRLAALPAWVRRERRRLAGASLLVHGQTAGRIILGSGVADGHLVHCVPLLSPSTSLSGCSRAAARTSVRQRLEIAPGVRLVLGSGRQAVGHRDTAWDRVLRSSGRPDVVAGRIHPAGDRPGQDAFRLLVDGREWSTEPLPLAALLAACDVFVAADFELHACSMAVAAVDWGVPVVSTTTDGVAELVLSGARGVVVQPRGDRVAAAVESQLDNGRVPVPPTSSADPLQRIAQLARAMLGIYRRELSAGVIGGAA